MSARKIALDALITCRKEEGWSNGVLKNLIRRNKLDRRDAALATRLCYGVLQNRLLLDHYLQQLLTGKLKDLHPALRDILHIGLYQILMMDKIPDSAAVNESVILAKKYCPKQRFAPGLANAVLRNASRRKDSLEAPATLAARYSHPKQLLELLKECVPEDQFEIMLRANNSVPDMMVQVNTLKTTTQDLIRLLETEEITVNPHPWMQNCLVLSGTGDLERLQAFQDGLFYVQDPASRLAVQCARIFDGAKVLDCCAAPGGKSFAAAMAAGETGQVISCDIHEHKTALIQNGAARLGMENIRVYQHDATQLRPEWTEQMDVVLCDVPCSGYGIIRKKPDIRYKDPYSMKELPLLQSEILLRQADYVKPGGVLLYSTCTLLKRENEEVVRLFLERRTDFFLEKLELPDVFPNNESGMLTLIPGVYDTDGFFICRLRRNA